MSLIKNAAPGNIQLGADDKSIKVLPPEHDPKPQHLPKFYIFAEKGPELAVPSGASKWFPMYGKNTFDMNKEFYNHATKYLTDIGGTGNVCMIHRLVPEDAGVRANATIYIDVLEDDIPNYVRNSTGGLVIDPDTNAYKVDEDNPTIPGYRIKFIKEVNNDELELGLRTQKTGTMYKEDEDGNKIYSSMYPVFELRAKWRGGHYNNVGFSLLSMFGDDADAAVLSKTKTMTYKLALFEREDEKSSPELLRTLAAEPAVMVSLKDKTVNPLSEQRFDIKTMFESEWFNETDVLKDIRYSDYEGLYVYEHNLNLVLGMLMTKEREKISSTMQTWDDGNLASTMEWFDFTTDDQVELLKENYLINVFGGKSTKNVRYFTFIHDDSTVTLADNLSEISFASNTPVFLGGGSNGTMDNEMYEKLLIKELEKYSDPNSEVQDTAINTETIMYDTGLSLTAKKALANFVALRKNTAVVLTTHTHNVKNKVLSITESRGVAQALKTRFRLAPESEYYGTPVARTVVIMGGGKVRGSLYPYVVGGNYELAIKAAKMMGASNYKWKKEELFDKAPGNILKYLVDYQPAFIADGIKATLWADGLVWAQPYDRVQYQFPAIQTIYDNDTSALNSFLTIMALCTASTIMDEAWRDFTGTTSLSDEEFVEQLTNYFEERFKGIFADLIMIVPQVELTENDKLRGYSWRVIIKIGAYNTKTKAVSSSEIYRQSDLAASLG